MILLWYIEVVIIMRCLLRAKWVGFLYLNTYVLFNVACYVFVDDICLIIALVIQLNIRYKTNQTPTSAISKQKSPKYEHILGESSSRNHKPQHINYAMPNTKFMIYSSYKLNFVVSETYSLRLLEIIIN